MALQEIYDLVATVNEKYNQILLNAKTIEELDEQLELVDTSFIHVSNNGVSEKLEIKKIIDAIVSGSLNELLFVGEITIDGNEVTVPSGVQWKIQGINYFTSTDFVQVVDFCSTGFIKKSIIVANTLNELIFIDGVEDESVAIRPNIPLNTVLVTELNVTDSGFDYVISNEYVKKAEFAENNVTGSSAISLVLNSEQTAFRLTSNAITVVEGTAPTTQYISSFGYTGKIITIINSTSSNKTIKHSLDPWCFQFPDGNDLILGPNEVLTMRQTKTTTPYFDMISLGRVVASGGGGSETLQQILENGATYTANGKTLTIYSDVISIFDNGTLSSLEIGMGDGPENDIAMIYSPNAGGQTELLFPKTESTENVAYQSYVDTGLSDKVDKVAGKQLSTEDYTTAEKSKLAGIASGATANDTDANLLNRANHTGTQAISTISGLQTYLNKINSGIVSSAEKTLTNTTSAQAIFDADLDAEANCAYEIFGSADFTGLAVVGSYLSFSLLGTATIDSFSVTVLANKAVNNTTPNFTVVQSNGTQITSSAAISSARLIFFGTVRVSGAGTVKPSVAFSSATASMKVSANSKFSFNKIGSNTVTNY